MAHELQITSVARPEVTVSLPRPLFLCTVPAGFPSPAGDYVEREIDLNDWLIGNRLATYVVQVEGDAMVHEIHPGDRLIVDRSLEPRPGDVVVACLDGEMLVRRLAVVAGRHRLVAEHPEYLPIELDGRQELIIWGVVTHSIHQLH